MRAVASDGHLGHYRRSRMHWRHTVDIRRLEMDIIVSSLAWPQGSTTMRAPNVGQPNCSQALPPRRKSSIQRTMTTRVLDLD